MLESKISTHDAAVQLVGDKGHGKLLVSLLNECGAVVQSRYAQSENWEHRNEVMVQRTFFYHAKHLDSQTIHMLECLIRESKKS